MFSTLLGALPRPPKPRPEGERTADPADAASDDEAVRTAIAAQEAAGLDLLSDGRLRRLIDLADPGASFVPEWAFAASCTARPVKQVLPGPYTLASRLGSGPDGAVRLAERLRGEIDALAAAGCTVVEIDEPDAARPAFAEADRALFRSVHLTLATDAPLHLSLALTGGAVDISGGGARTFLDPPYASYAVDLIGGPDNWRFVAEVPQGRGVVCGALAAAVGGDEGAELLVWAAYYAGSTAGRGLDRVGLANAPGLSALPWDVAVRKLERLAAAARVAALPPGEQLRSALDPRAIDLRSRALGRRVPRGTKERRTH
ncbi:MAG TPA: hypothetical protein VM344_09560 [Vitreimonas sp.]|nr:hypothetical protein [Vitreimonas sp.]